MGKGEKGEVDGEVDEEEIEAITTGAGADEQADGCAAAAGGEGDEKEPESTNDDELQ
uniref:Uncharacterized protein n=1 Tax=Aegilops tauschii TaxID=37682 RepID=M8D1X5_AEGTA